MGEGLKRIKAKVKRDKPKRPRGRRRVKREPAPLPQHNLFPAAPLFDPKHPPSCALCMDVIFDTPAKANDAWCSGCSHYVCDECSVNYELPFGGHRVKDHAKDPLDDEDIGDDPS